MTGVTTIAAVCAAVVSTAAGAPPLDELMPVPKAVVAGEGRVAAERLRNVTVVRGAVPEAPVATADEAYVLEVGENGAKLALTGRLPVSKQLPFQWYDTPNIHCITLKDFRSLCDKEGIKILEVRAESRHLIGRLLLALGFKNLGASRIIARIARK